LVLQLVSSAMPSEWQDNRSFSQDEKFVLCNVDQEMQLARWQQRYAHPPTYQGIVEFAAQLSRQHRQHLCGQCCGLFFIPGSSA